MLLSFVFIVIRMVRALVFGLYTITWETYILEDYNIELYLLIKNSVY